MRALPPSKWTLRYIQRMLHDGRMPDGQDIPGLWGERVGTIPAEAELAALLGPPDMTEE